LSRRIQRRELPESSLLIDAGLGAPLRGGPLDLYEAYKTRVIPSPSLPVHVRNSRVVGHPEYPRLQRVPGVKNFEASPELEVDALPEIVSGVASYPAASRSSERPNLPMAVLHNSASFGDDARCSEYGSAIS